MAHYDIEGIRKKLAGKPVEEIVTGGEDGGADEQAAE